MVKTACGCGGRGKLSQPFWATPYLVAMCILASLTALMVPLHGALGEGVCIGEARFTRPVSVCHPPLVGLVGLFEALAFSGIVVVAFLTVRMPRAGSSLVLLCGVVGVSSE